MSTRDLVRMALALVVGGCASAGVTPGTMESPNLGHEATPAQIAGWDISVGPDGVGLPPGKGTPAMGATVYEQKCQVCHGAKGAGQPNDRLVGGRGRSRARRRCAPSVVIGRTRRPSSITCAARCPYLQSQSLSDDEVYAVTAYLLDLNGIIGENDEMNAQTLPKVMMPNRSNFIIMYPSQGK